ncbi:MAG: hypothetical protein AAEF72_06050, partial [Gammaproteobacteria bacterium]
PLMTADEREQVGTCYQDVGKKAALELGHQLVSGLVKEQRLDAGWHFFKAIQMVFCIVFVAACAHK